MQSPTQFFFSPSSYLSDLHPDLDQDSDHSLFSLLRGALRQPYINVLVIWVLGFYNHEGKTPTTRTVIGVVY